MTRVWGNCVTPLILSEDLHGFSAPANAGHRIRRMMFTGRIKPSRAGRQSRTRRRTSTNIASRSTVLILGSVSVVRPSCCANCPRQLDVAATVRQPLTGTARRHYAAEHRAEIEVTAFRNENTPPFQSASCPDSDTRRARTVPVTGHVAEWCRPRTGGLRNEDRRPGDALLNRVSKLERRPGRRRNAGNVQSRRLHRTRRNVQFPSPLMFGPHTVPL